MRVTDSFFTDKERYRKNLKMVVRILRGDIDLAEDIVQEAYTRAWQYRHSYNPNRAKIQTWFNSILFNTLRDVQRKEREKGIVKKLHDGIEEFVPFEKIEEHLNLVYTEIMHVVGKEKIRRVLYLHYLLGYNSKEISEIEQGVTQTNVTTISNRFKELIREKHGVKL